MFSYVFMKILEARPRTYDRHMDRLSGGRAAALRRRVAEEVEPGAHVLEVGCGPGTLAAALVEKGATVLAFDADPAMVARARERAGAGGELEVLEMGVEGMDQLPGGAFDVVVSTLVLSELSDDERRYALKHARRVLRPGGRLVVAVEVLPRSAAKRIAYRALRAPAAAATYLVAGASTRPVRDLRGDVERVGLKVLSEERSHGDSVELLIAVAPEEPAPTNGGES